MKNVERTDDGKRDENAGADGQVGRLAPYANNPRNNDGAVDAVAMSIQTFGFLCPIVARPDGEILAGHTRYRAALKLNLSEVPVIYAKDLDDAKARAFRIADNKVGDLSTFDNRLLLSELDAIAELDPNVFTGFEVGELFDGELDEKDNEVTTEEKEGTVYKVILKTRDKERAERFLANFKAEEGL